MAHIHGKAVLDSLRDPAVALRRAIPAVYEGFSALSGAAMADGALTKAQKEVIALAIAAANQCDGCIASHARSAARAGATAEQVAEAMGVVILMNGGPGTVYGPRAYDAFLEYLESEQK